ncbi:cell wall metabolism sensor histidine kinase WalK [Streptomyces sp. TLI_105]|uniref:sensor histidine kinase n=1 Tax=Streptomyces sp. TLI_105 TaxID=1881019 RepID=UPI000895D98C|nr:HAMP domain-containing sensor histidine kinase [Streptomyces sp. TLI_105]SEC09410.1 Signal transduction histidine kinase [Streptomyces sp. TLI_105]
MGVRFWSAVAAVLVVAVGLIAGAVALIALLRAELTDDVRQAVRGRAEQVAAVIESGRGVPSLTVSDQDEQFVQVLDARGDVIAASPNVKDLPALADPRQGSESTLSTPLDEDRFLVVAVSAEAPGGDRTVLVGQTLIGVDESTRIVTRLLVTGLPLLMLVVAGATWMAVGRALAPVAAIRSEVEAISAAELHRRVPLPPGRDEIARLAATMNRMLDRLERAQSAQRRFISDASHELRSPVASIRQHAEVALAHPDRLADRATRERLARTVLSEDLRIQRLVDDLLLLARADEEALRPRLRPVDLDDLVLDEVRRLRRVAPGLRIGTAGVSAARRRADPRGLGRVVRNLGDNAARHARSEVAFDLAEQPDGRVVLGVEDDGPGVPPADRERVFERFVRLDEARSRRPGDGGDADDAGGSGLGLAIVAELVAAHGGTATVTDGRLGGARFEVALPPDPGA